MMERQGLITFLGNGLTLLGDPIKQGDKAPDFTVLDNDLAAKSLADFSEKVLVIASVPSVDTPVCDLETRRFNAEAGNFGKDVKVLTISMDLPFAQKRWCAAAGVEQVQTLSDHRDAAFGANYGLLIKELRLLARAVMVLDADRTITYMQLVPEVASEPDYEKVLNAIKKLL
jgi:thioredoxin-dependent peroxiredoxin